MTPALETGINRPLRQKSRRIVPVLRPLAVYLALAMGMPAQASVIDAQHAQLWHAALHDPRFRHTGLLDREARAALARAYGVERLLPGHPDGATVRVDNCSDSGAGSLRAAVASAPNGATVDASALTCASITFGSGEIVVAQDTLNIVGPGKHALTLGGKYNSRFFKHVGHGTLSLSGMKIAGGQVANVDLAQGGCLYTQGNLVLGSIFDSNLPETGVVLDGCRAASNAGGKAQGGAIYAFGTLAMTNSVVSGSTAEGGSGGSAGGGVFTYTGLSTKYTEVRDNVAGGPFGIGGGISTYLARGDVLINASTIAGNVATDSGGGADFFNYAVGTLEIRNSTVSSNTADHAGGLSIQLYAESDDESARSDIYSSTITRNVATSYERGAGLTTPNSLDIYSTIIAGNFKGGNVPDDLDNRPVNDAFTFGADNLIGVFIGSVPDDTRIGVDPRLGSLANHGGSTRTHLLGAASPAIDAGDNAEAESFDQRGSGHPRVLGSRADIGSTELDPDRIFGDGFD